MIDNRPLLRRLLSSGQLRLQPSSLLDTSPPPIPETVTWDRIEGMLLGLAIGDSLGFPTESQTPSERFAAYGEIRDYLPSGYANWMPVGAPSDDTQMAAWTMEQTIADGGLVPEHVAVRFGLHELYGIGLTVAACLANLDAGMPWYEAAITRMAAGNGALMRIAPVLIPHLRRPSPALWADVAIAASITHNDPASTGSCLAFTYVLWECIRMERPPAPEWWIDTFCSVLAPLEGETSYRSQAPGIEYCGPLWRFTKERVRDALRRGLSTVDACNSWYSGAYLMETVPSVLYILCRHANDPNEAIVRAVNDTFDNDTVAAIVGAAVGALHGTGSLEERWRRNLLGRTTADDDGRLFELIAQAKAAWWD